MSKVDQRTTSHTVGTVIESAESLVSHCPQIATSVGDTEEDLENETAQRSRNRGKRKQHSLSSVLICSLGRKRKRYSHGSEHGHTLSRLGQEEVRVEGVIRQTIRNTSLMLSEDITNLALADVNHYMRTLSRLFKALVALQSKE